MALRPCRIIQGYLSPSPGALCRRLRSRSGSLSAVEVESRAAQAMLPGLRRRSTKPDCSALTASVRAIYQEAQRGNPNAIAFPPEDIPEMQVVASSPGSGKSTSAKAFMLAVAREGLKDKYPLGCALVVQHVETAADATKN